MCLVWDLDLHKTGVLVTACSRMSLNAASSRGINLGCSVGF